jgi:hypothetical protein
MVPMPFFGCALPGWEEGRGNRQGYPGIGLQTRPPPMPKVYVRSQGGDKAGTRERRQKLVTNL